MKGDLNSRQISTNRLWDRGKQFRSARKISNMRTKGLRRNGVKISWKTAKLKNDYETIECCQLSQAGMESKVGQYGDTEFLGVCLDIGAQKTVLGIKQALAHCELSNSPFHTKKSRCAFKFGNHIYPSLGTLNIRIPVPQNGFLDCQVDVVQGDVPFLIGLGFLDSEKLVADNIDNVLRSKEYNWKIPLSRKHGHMCEYC